MGIGLFEHQAQRQRRRSPIAAIRGRAFQLADDLLDITSGPSQSGKTPGTDLREGVATLPVLLPLMTHPGFRFEEFAKRHPDSPMFVLRHQLVLFMMEEQRAGRIGAIDPGAAAMLVWSTAQTIAFFERLGAHGGQFETELIRKTVQCIWDGLAPE